MGQPGGAENAEKNSMAILWIIGSIFAIGYIIWSFYGEALQRFFLFVRTWEVRLINLFVSGERIENLEARILELTPDTLTLAMANAISELVGEYLRWPVAILLAVMAWLVFRGHMTMRFVRVHNMQTLLAQEKFNWPAVSLVEKLNLTDMDINTGPWAMAQTPLQFAKKHKLLKVEQVPEGKGAWRSQSQYKATVDREKAHRVFALQLGPLFNPNQILKMPKHAQALFAIFAARSAHDTEGSRALLDRLSISAGRGNMDYSGVMKLLTKHIKAKPVERCMQRHAYITTLLASMLELGRTDGVLAAAEFLWLKPIDRRLWYMLNSVGRQVVFSEIAGAYAHWLAEKELQRPLSVPLIAEATRALEDGIAKVVYVPEEDEVIKAG